MKIKCLNCGGTLTGEESYCPYCSEKVVNRCRECGKELDSFKHKYCPLCKEKKDNNRKNVLKKLSTGAVTVIAVTTTVLKRGIFKKK